jgi:threonine/homoserine/homoserine lactone efflux protein
MLSFAAAVFFLIVTPGPGVLSTAGVGSAFGFRSGLAYVGGLFLGTNLVALAVVSGMAAVLLAVPFVRTVLVYASVAYLLYLAARIALAGSRIAFIEARKAPGFLNGVALQAINPKAYAVNTALFSGFAFWPESLLAETAMKFLILNTETAMKFLILNIIWVPVHLAWLFAGVTLRRLDLPSHVQFAINVAMALSMLAVVALTALTPH